MAERQILLGVGEHTNKGIRIDSKVVMPIKTNFEEMVEELRLLIEEDELNQEDGELED